MVEIIFLISEVIYNQVLMLGDKDKSQGGMCIVSSIVF
jgi:hypothetical protein